MVTALYRRYRPDTFAEMIGQSQVTEPLMTALRTNRVNHAYLFSGPRGCGKTTSARILARCLNCAEGPTDTPCGKCASCIELSRDGSGSLDVVEIDAASHNGVDDARDIRERAIFAPARDRYKIFILDEAHMVTPQGFNALLKIVEEPPEHVKFIFATTEPEKVIGTIRSRTHHYPFRLVPPAQMLEYVQSLCDSEGMTVAPGVLPLVVRAGGGSPRDTLSLLDQLMAGSEGSAIEYERAVALLGYTHAALLDDVIDTIAARDAAGAFAAVDRVIQTGQDPRRFVEDLLERLRDLIVVAATSVEGAAAVLRGVPQDELDRMGVQAMKFGAAELSRAADIVNAALTEMTGATSPRLHLELMIARVLVPSSDESERGALARVERLERRVGVSDAVGPGRAAQPERAPAAAAVAAVAESPAAGSAVSSQSAAGARAGEVRAGELRSPEGRATEGRATEGRTTEGRTTEGRTTEGRTTEGRTTGGPTSEGQTLEGQTAEGRTAEAPASQTGRSSQSPESPAPAAGPSAAAPTAAVVGAVTTQQVKDAWPQILDAVQRAKRSAWMVVFTAQVRSLNGDVLTLSFPSENDVQSFRQPEAGGAPGVSEYLRQGIVDVLGIRVKFIARADSTPGPGAAPRPSAGAPTVPVAETWPGADSSGLRATAEASATAGSAVPASTASGADPAHTGGAPAASAASSSLGQAGPASAGSSSVGPAGPASAAPDSAAIVTEWATVTIPSASAQDAGSSMPVNATASVATMERPAETATASAPAASDRTPASRGEAAPDEPPYDDVPPPEIEPPFEPPVPEEPAGDWAAAPTAAARPARPASALAASAPPAAAPVASTPSAPATPGAATSARAASVPSASASGASVPSASGASAPSASASGASASGASAPAPSTAAPGVPARSASAPAAAGSRTPTFQQPQRYGEAVVREILGATFIEEQPAPPNPGMR
ncbi:MULTISPECIES: DNA polymerase III subunit gamma and tau [unclassified Leifsonia]|uniref:DNA polymerase III subunit gamma and tau n=1 Tax=unclassified Leifsonia TaxID=2663824 RepID=UPI0008A799A4|nr:MULTISPECIES: DNA polymerase III subunit gamma and tau [unclassified Leifsonia]SEI07353.1 DNA polymerase-3 subunit gamma/tau [Leifsonia sp. CL154]SFL81219.1 DNA polymerase-3 subunit gamma/tau [Leifsonia sp. CL147]